MLAGCAGFLVVGSQFALYAMCPLIYAPPTRGTGTGAALAVGRMGAVLGPVFVGVLLGNGINGGHIILRMLPIVFATGLAAFWLTVVDGSLRSAKSGVGR